MDRKVFFSEGGVSVSNLRFIANGHIFNITDILAVKLGVVEPQRGLAGFSIMIGLLLLLAEGALFVVGGFSIVLGVLTWVSTKTKYAVLLETTSGDYKVLLDSNSQYIEQIIHALDAAMVNRDAPMDGSALAFAKAKPVPQLEAPSIGRPAIG